MTQDNQFEECALRDIVFGKFIKLNLGRWKNALFEGR